MREGDAREEPFAAIAALRALAPGIALSTAVAVAAVASAPLVAPVAPIPAMVIALIIGIALNRLAEKRMFRDGILFCVKTLLRWAVASGQTTLVEVKLAG